jgi:hypothetical protein
LRHDGVRDADHLGGTDAKADHQRLAPAPDDRADRPIVLPGPLPIIIQPVVIVGKRDPFSEDKFNSLAPNSLPAGDAI